MGIPGAASALGLNLPFREKAGREIERREEEDDDEDEDESCEGLDIWSQEIICLHIDIDVTTKVNEYPLYS